jgi:hypothetical protein
LGNGGSFKKAAKVASVAYSTVWERRKSDPVFARSEDDAVKRAQRLLESEAIRRAVEGTKRIRFQPKTGKIYYDTEFSDVLLLRLLEKNETGSWRRNHVVEQRNEFCFKTRAERKAALEKMRAAMQQQAPVTTALNRQDESQKSKASHKNAWALSGVSEIQQRRAEQSG